MAPPDAESDSTDRLSGWKDIAAYVGKSVKSVQRWERDLGLPVRRIKTGDGQIVSASRREIDDWRAHLEGPGQVLRVAGAEAPEDEPRSEAQPPAGPPVPGQPGPRLRGPRTAPAAAALIILVVFAVLAGWWLHSYLPGSAASPLAAMILVGRNLEARDAAGRVVWTYSFNTEVSRPLGESRRVAPRDDRVAEVDLDGDGVVEHLVPVRFDPPQQGQSASTDALYAFSGDGRLLWSVAPKTTLSCGGQTFEAPWNLSATQISQEPGRKRIWLAYVHHVSWPSFIVEVDPDGRSVLKYLQTGWIMSLAEWQTPAGVRLVAGGVIHDEDRPSVVLLDPDGPAAISPDTDPRFLCGGAPTGQPAQVTLLPKFDLLAAAGVAYGMVGTLKVVGPDLQAESDSVVATVAPDGAVKSLLFGDVYWARHRRLEMERKLSHPAARCPETTTPQEIRAWTAGGGWQRYFISPPNLLNPAR